MTTRERKEAKLEKREEWAISRQKKAEGLRHQLDNTIFSDDTNAIQELEKRITGRGKLAERIKRYNKTCVKTAKEDRTFGDLNLLTTIQKTTLIGYLKNTPSHMCEGGKFPPFYLTNLQASIRKDTKRIEIVKTQQNRIKLAKDAVNGFAITGPGEYVRITFAEKPGRDVIEALKSAEFHWQGGSWQGKKEKISTILRSE